MDSYLLLKRRKYNMEVLLYVLLVSCVLLLGIAIGLIIGARKIRRNISGDLLITSDEDGYYLSLDLDRTIYDIKGWNQVIFRVKDISQK